MKHNVTRYSMIALLIALVVLTAGPANAHGGHRIEILSFSWGITPGQTARVSVANFVFLDGSVRSNHPAVVRIQLLDTEGEVVAESDEIRVEPGQTGFWDAPYEQIGGVREATGRLQLRARIEVKTNAGSQPPQLGPALELFDSSTGVTRGRQIFQRKFTRIQDQGPLE
jgi:prepilin-type processing-associated H-X9-DG protein